LRRGGENRSSIEKNGGKRAGFWISGRRKGRELAFFRVKNNAHNAAGVGGKKKRGHGRMIVRKRKKDDGELVE